MSTETKYVFATPDRKEFLPPDTNRAWYWIGWLALVLALAGLSDWTLAWVPLRFGSPEWEFGTIVASFSGLPLVTMGLAGVLGSAIARGIRWQIVTAGVVIMGLAVLILCALVIFALDVPIALGAVRGVARLGILKAIAKTAFLGALFFTAYAVTGVGVLRYVASRNRNR